MSLWSIQEGDLYVSKNTNVSDKTALTIRHGWAVYSWRHDGYSLKYSHIKQPMCVILVITHSEIYLSTINSRLADALLQIFWIMGLRRVCQNDLYKHITLWDNSQPHSMIQPHLTKSIGYGALHWTMIRVCRGSLLSLLASLGRERPPSLSDTIYQKGSHQTRRNSLTEVLVTSSHFFSWP